MKRAWVLALPFLLCTMASAQLPSVAPLSFHVTGDAQALPDSAIIHFTISGEGETLGKAQEQSKTTEQAVGQALEKFDIKRSSIHTDRFGAAPIQATMNSYQSSGAGVLPLGYRVTRDCSVKVPITADALDKVLQIADAVLSLGTRPTGSSSAMCYDGSRQPVILEFVTSDPMKLTQQAMEDALAKAKKLAEQTASQMQKPSVKLVAVKMTEAKSTPDCRNPMPASEQADPITSSTWQPVHMSVSIDATSPVQRVDRLLCNRICLR